MSALFTNFALVVNGIFLEIMLVIRDWFCTYVYTFEGIQFTLLDYFTYCCVIFVIAYFVWHIIFLLPDVIDSIGHTDL